MAEKRVRTLYLLRHAKSDRPAGVDDMERPLAGRGRRDAKAVAAFLVRRPAPQFVFCSPSLRTRQTWQLARQGMGSSPRVRFEPLIYGAHWAELVNLIRRSPADADTVMVIGHEPTMSEVAERLAGSGSNRSALRQLSVKFPTSGIATFELSGPWADLKASGGRLSRFDVPRG